MNDNLFTNAVNKVKAETDPEKREKILSELPPKTRQAIEMELKSEDSSLSSD